MARESLLKGTSFKTTSDDRRAVALEEAQQGRSTAFENLVIVIDDMAESISEGHDKPIDGLTAEKAFLEQLTEGLTSNGGRITQHFANGYAVSDDAGELESVRGELGTAQQQLVEVEQTNAELRRSATEASNLQAQLLVLQQELIDERAKVTALQTEVSQLTTEKADLERELNEEKQAHGRTKDELGELRQQRVDPPSPSPQPDPEPPAAAPSGDPVEPEPADQPVDEPPHQSPHTLTPREEVQRRSGIRGAIDRVRGSAPGHSNPHNTPKDGEK